MSRDMYTSNNVICPNCQFNHGDQWITHTKQISSWRKQLTTTTTKSNPNSHSTHQNKKCCVRKTAHLKAERDHSVGTGQSQINTKSRTWSFLLHLVTSISFSFWCLTPTLFLESQRQHTAPSHSAFSFTFFKKFMSVCLCLCTREKAYSFFQSTAGRRHKRAKDKRSRTTHKKLRDLQKWLSWGLKLEKCCMTASKGMQTSRKSSTQSSM